MSYDEIYLGPTPCEEECAQVGTPNYSIQARKECKRYIETIRKALGKEPQGAKLIIKSCSHDFGLYYEVICLFDTDNTEAVKYAFKCESDGPTTWEKL